MVVISAIALNSANSNLGCTLIIIELRYQHHLLAIKEISKMLITKNSFNMTYLYYGLTLCALQII